MKRHWPWIVFGIFALYVVSGFRPVRPKGEYDLPAFGKLPVLHGGRLQPFDSMARNSLLVFRGKQTVLLEERQWWPYRPARKMGATEWLLEVFTRPEQANQRKIFRIDHPDLQSLWHEPSTAGENEYFSFAMLEPKLPELLRQADEIQKREKAKITEPQQRTPYENQLMKLAENVLTYQGLQNSLKPVPTEHWESEVREFMEAVKTAAAAYLQDPEAAAQQPAFKKIEEQVERYARLAEVITVLPIPPHHHGSEEEHWESIYAHLLESARNREVSPPLQYLITMASAYGRQEAAAFNTAVNDYRAYLEEHHPKALAKAGSEFVFNHYAPFIKSMALYLTALVLAFGHWVNGSSPLRRTAWLLGALALVVHTSGLIFRMALEGRPPVTNLYSSAIFVGWGAAVLGLILERFQRNGVGLVVASSVGFVTLIIAHHLSLSGDTMQMLVAVLDTNLWLATHVVVITLGYSSMFVAGLLGILYILRGVFSRSLHEPEARALARMAYGIVCFATLFSFVGTVLGGIWADQSWGRFWGWDPKENGALLIVLWNAAILHCRWGGLIKERGLMNMVVFGNVITSFSWFGVNMLGIGLHTYGFMEQAFYWLMAFVASQLILIGIGSLPLRYWKSFKSTPRARSQPELVQPA